MLKPDDKDDIILYITVIGVPVDNLKRLHISIVDCVDLFCIRFSCFPVYLLYHHFFNLTNQNFQCINVNVNKFDLNIFVLQHKAIGVGNNFKNLDRPLPVTTFKSISPQGNVCVCILKTIKHLLHLLTEFVLVL